MCRQALRDAGRSCTPPGTQLSGHSPSIRRPLCPVLMVLLQELFLLPLLLLLLTLPPTSSPLTTQCSLLRAGICPRLLLSLGFCFVPYFWESFHLFATLLSLSLSLYCSLPKGDDSVGSGRLSSRTHYLGQHPPTRSPLRSPVV